ncbi:MAG: helix-turn-helix transcriptional regulator [Acidobacteriota bacterium]|nr:helix-turn-helix transcriptional regulator [Acidobacteriota bacterium]
MKLDEKKISEKSSATPSVKRMVEDVIGCKWSLSVLELIRQGVNRPGAIERSVEGLTTKVLNERLRKLVGYGVLRRKVFAEVPPHVEYSLTDFGRKFVEILDTIESLEHELCETNSLLPEIVF